jgi:hypothetical protein
VQQLTDCRPTRFRPRRTYYAQKKEEREAHRAAKRAAKRRAKQGAGEL